MATLRVEVECGEKTCDGCQCCDKTYDWCLVFDVHLLWAGTGAGNVLMRCDACLAAEDDVALLEAICNDPARSLDPHKRRLLAVLHDHKLATHLAAIRRALGEPEVTRESLDVDLAAQRSGA